MRRNGMVAPRILQLVAAIGNVNNFDTVFLGDFLEAAGLVSQLIGEQQQPFGRICHGEEFSLRQKKLSAETVATLGAGCGRPIEIN